MRKILLLLVAVIVVGGGAYSYYRYTQKVVPATITTARITQGDLAETVGATGALQAVTTVQVGTQVSGTIEELNADFNSLVRKGQVLARLDPSLIQSQIEQARANLIRAEADLERLRVSLENARTKLVRAKELTEKKLIAQIELEAAEVAVRSAEAQLRSQEAGVTQSQASLRQNQVNLAHTVIESPIDGLVISRNVDVGQTVAASMSAPTLFVLAADLTKMQVLASLDESDVGRIRPGQAVRFRVDAYPADEFVGSVTQVRLQPTTVQNVVTYQTVIDVPNPELKLKPGMTANVNVEIARRSNVLRVPNAALRFRPTAEIFAALGQTPPPSGTGGGRGRGAGGSPDTRNTAPAATPMPAAQPVAQQQRPATPQRPAAQQHAPGQTAQKGEVPQLTPPADGSGPQVGRGEGGNGERRGGRGNFAERMAGMTPEERERFMERMRERGFTPRTDGETPGAASTRGGRGQGPRQQTPAQAAKPAASPATGSGATTFDSLFGPLTQTETFGQAWLNDGGKLMRMRLRLGITDGQQTELIQALDGELKDGTEVVTNVITGAVRQAPTAPGGTAFPGLGGGRQGFPGGGGGGNRGGRGQ
ncbi:MAG TPA: efflux RND transporter periplasmic adaptor subunit [Vicinamibacterales bacterium]